MLKIQCYSFYAQDEEHKKLRGKMDAPSKAIAHIKLINMGLTHIYYVRRNITSIKKIFLLTLTEKHHFFSQLSMLVQSGVSLIDGLSIMQQEAASFKIKYLCYLLLRDLSQGNPLSKALEKIYCAPFSKLEIQLMHAAEISGKLDETLQFIQKKLQNQQQRRKKIIAALIYPTITLIVGLCMTLIIFQCIVPQFAGLFGAHHRHLPWLTASIFAFSRHLGKICSLFLIVCSVMGIALRTLRAEHWWGSAKRQRWIKKLPIVGKMIMLTDRINFCYTFALLLRAGVPIVETIQQASEQVLLPHSKNQLHQARHALSAGNRLTTVLKKTDFLSKSALQILFSAEHSGRLEEAWTYLGQQFSEEFNFFLEYLGKILEPFIIILLGVMIGVIVIAVYLPIFQLGSLY